MVPIDQGIFEVVSVKTELIASAPHFGNTKVTIAIMKRIDDMSKVICTFDILWTTIQDIRRIYLFEYTIEQIGYR